MVRPSQRAGWDLSPNALTLACERRLHEGKDLIDLVQSNPTVVGLPAEHFSTFRVLGAPEVRVYEPSPRGLLSAREHVAAWYRSQGLAVDPSQLLLTSSSSEAYSFLLKLLCDSGDSILVPSPSYPLFDQLARLDCVSVDRYPLMAEDGWRIDFEALEDAIHSRTRAIFLVSPNNPTGSYLHEDERRTLEDLARRHGLALVCDEVFAEYIWKDTSDRVKCAALEAEVPTFSLGGLSKSACLPQMKLGWIIAGGPSWEEALTRLEMIADTYLSVSGPVQHAAGALLGMATELREALSCRIRDNLRVLEKSFCEDSPVRGCCVDAGWYGCLRVPAILSDEQWAELLVEEEGVLVHPGSFYGFSRAGVLVCGLIAPLDEFDVGLRRIHQRIQAMV